MWRQAIIVLVAAACLVQGQVAGGPYVAGADGYTTVPFNTASAMPQCTAISTNNYAFTDPLGFQFVMQCGTATAGNTIANPPTAPNWRGCVSLCNSTIGCSGFSFNAANYGEASGTCNIKTGHQTAFGTATAATRVAVYARASFTPSPNYQCPAVDKTNVTSLLGATYLVGCGNDSYAAGSPGKPREVKRKGNDELANTA